MLFVVLKGPIVTNNAIILIQIVKYAIISTIGKIILVVRLIVPLARQLGNTFYKINRNRIDKMRVKIIEEVTTISQVT